MATRIIIFVFGLFFVFLSDAYAVKQIKVLKVGKSGKAMVKFPEGVEPEKGQKFDIKVDVDELIEEDTSEGSPRNWSVGGGFSYQSGTTETTVEVDGSSSDPVESTFSGLTLSALLGKNWGSFELGGYLAWIRATAGGDNTDSTSSSMAVGPYLDFNFISNQPGQGTVPGIRAQVGYLSSSDETSVGSNSTESVYSGYEYFVAGFCKFFIVDSTNLRVDLGYQGSSKSGGDAEDTSSTTTTARSGLVLQVGLQTYF